MPRKQLVISFDDKGDMTDQAVDQRWANQGYKFEEAKDFDDRMEFVDLHEFYRRSGRAYFKSLRTGRKYTMFLADFNLLVKAKRFVDNQIEGTFTFVKRSSGQAIQMLLENKP